MIHHPYLFTTYFYSYFVHIGKCSFYFLNLHQYVLFFQFAYVYSNFCFHLHINTRPSCIGSVQTGAWASLGPATRHSPSGYPNGNCPKATCRSAAKSPSVCWTPQGCANSAKVFPQKELAFWGDFLEVTSMEHFACAPPFPPCKRPCILWTAKIACSVLRWTPGAERADAQQEHALSSRLPATVGMRSSGCSLTIPLIWLQHSVPYRDCTALLNSFDKAMHYVYVETKTNPAACKGP